MEADNFDLASVFKESSLVPSSFILEKLFKIFAEGEKLPTFPESLNGLQGILYDENVTVEKVSTAIGRDVGLTAQLIRLANSPAYRGADDLRTVDEAVMRIGLKEVRSAASAALLISEFQKMSVQVDWLRFWAHSLLAGQLTERIYQLHRPTEGGEYLAGLLHDVGKLLLFQHLPNEFEQVLVKVNQTGKSMFEVENELFGLNHAQVGAALCRKWNLHPKIWGAILHHHEVEKGCFWAACVHVADHIANRCYHGFHEEKEFLENEDLIQLPTWRSMKNAPLFRSTRIPLAKEHSKAHITAGALLS